MIWVNLSDRLPTEADGVIIITGSNMPTCIGSCEGGYYTFNECEDLHNYFEGGANWLLDNWKYWMPLPPTPKQQRHGAGE